jgi:hypothetical protein
MGDDLAEDWVEIGFCDRLVDFLVLRLGSEFGRMGVRYDGIEKEVSDVSKG